MAAGGRMSLGRILLLLALLVCNSALAETWPAALREGSTHFLARSLGVSCYTMDSVLRGLPCNPAMIAKERRPRFDMDILLGGNIEYIKEAEDILRGHDSEAAVVEFFSSREAIEGEFSLEASFQAPTWGLSLEPYRIVAVSRFENPALPMVDFVIAEERSVKGQWASYVGKDFYAGIQVRYTQVHFIGDYFALSEAFAGNREDLFDEQTEELFFLEPGILFSWEDLAWQPQISAMLAQWGKSRHKKEPFLLQPAGHLGVSVKPFVPLGLLEVGIQFQVDSETENAREAFRGGLAYQLGILQAVLSASDENHAAGFLVVYKNYTSGLSYWNEKQSRGVFIQLGVTL